ncbi:hypothetical protein, partial [Neglectibacter sp. 59]|uniref:hypothetical protein n=1 Tax=Neglectibacter sp. 59 TaxID=2304573 RepID=UPI0013BDBCB5
GAIFSLLLCTFLSLHPLLKWYPNAETKHQSYWDYINQLDKFNFISYFSVDIFIYICYYLNTKYGI